MSDRKKPISDLNSLKKNAGAHRRPPVIRNQSSDEEDNRDRGQQSFYVGGSEQSGQQVLGPGNPDDLQERDFVSRVFNAARAHGAEAMHGEAEPAGGTVRTSAGHDTGGYRLGDLVRPSEHIVGESAGGPAPQQRMQRVNLTMYRNGFTVDNGPFRSFQESGSRAFMDSVMAGRIPVELQRRFPGREVDLRMERKDEEYQPPAAEPFSGQGHRLGEIVPIVVGAGSVGERANVGGTTDETGKDEVSEERGQAEVKLRDGEPVTHVQLRLPDGQRITGRFNHAHTVNDLRTFVIGAVPSMAFEPFTLMNSYPSRELTDDNSSLKDLGLLNALIVVKLV